MIHLAGLVILYTMTGCGHCEQEKSWLQQHHIKYEERNISNPQYYQQLMSYGMEGTPVTVINGKVIEGFSPSEIQAALK